MLLSEFDFPFDPAMVALRPTDPRDAVRLMLVPRAGGQCLHRHMLDLPSLLEPGDLLVLNDTRVLPVRLDGRKRPGGGKINLLFVKELADGVWEALLSGGAKPGQVIEIDEQTVVSVLSNGAMNRVQVNGLRPLQKVLEEKGQMPLPPYIKRAPIDQDRSWYQTVFARQDGSIAAPTAGLHFSDRLFTALAQHGVRVATITLHVGPGTFLPVRTAEIEQHTMAPEAFEIPPCTAEAIGQAQAEGRRVVAVGTTVVRALETAAAQDSVVMSTKGDTNLFIAPGYSFRAVNGMLTNFHLPRSTLLMLVAAFAGLDWTRAAYGEAMKAGYRLYSYGDAMLIL
jgi:S-adenosylmethionine:tRNA ribosyltransferase-isomerase